MLLIGINRLRAQLKNNASAGNFWLGKPALVDAPACKSEATKEEAGQHDEPHTQGCAEVSLERLAHLLNDARRELQALGGADATILLKQKIRSLEAQVVLRHIQLKQSLQIYLSVYPWKPVLVFYMAIPFPDNHVRVI